MSIYFRLFFVAVSVFGNPLFWSVLFVRRYLAYLGKLIKSLQPHHNKTNRETLRFACISSGFKLGRAVVRMLIIGSHHVRIVKDVADAGLYKR